MRDCYHSSQTVEKVGQAQAKINNKYFLQRLEILDKLIKEQKTPLAT